MEPIEPTPLSQYPFTREVNSIIVPRGTETSVEVLEMMGLMRDKLNEAYEGQWKSAFDKKQNAFVIKSDSQQLLDAAEGMLQALYDKRQKPPSGFIE